MTQHDRRDAVTTNETIRPPAVRMLEYLETVHRLREQPVCDVAGYQDRYWWAGDIPRAFVVRANCYGRQALVDGVAGAALSIPAHAGGHRTQPADRDKRCREGARIGN